VVPRGSDVKPFIPKAVRQKKPTEPLGISGIEASQRALLSLSLAVLLHVLIISLFSFLLRTLKTDCQLD